MKDLGSAVVALFYATVIFIIVIVPFALVGAYVIARMIWEALT